MLSKTKNIIIFLAIAIVLVLVYVFFIKKSPNEENLISSSGNSSTTMPTSTTSSLDKDFLPFLLNVKNIKLDDSIFSDPAFVVLIDANVVLVPEGNEGRPNPFAPFGVENNTSNKPVIPPAQSN